MKSFIKLLIILELLSSNLNAQSFISNMYFEKQKQSNWCWAAVTAMVYRNLTKNDDYLWQCKLASHHILGRDNGYCCEGNNGSSSSCNQPAVLSEILKAESLYDGAHYGGIDSTTWTRMMKEIRLGYPVAIHIGWDRQNVGHAILFYGLTMGGFSGGQGAYFYDPTAGAVITWSDDLDHYAYNTYGSNGSVGAVYYTKQPN